MEAQTERGFSNYGEFVDSKGSVITIRQSSAACEPCVWIFVKNEKDAEAQAHLTLNQIDILIGLLREVRADFLGAS